VFISDLIGLMTDDTPANRPTVSHLVAVCYFNDYLQNLTSFVQSLEKFKQLSTVVLAATMKEVDRKRALRREIQVHRS
jgi:hypothetical protein